MCLCRLLLLHSIECKIPFTAQCYGMIVEVKVANTSTVNSKTWEKLLQNNNYVVDLRITVQVKSYCI